MNALGCLFALFLIACIMAFFFVAAMWVVVGTIFLIAKLIVWMAYVGAAALLIGFVVWLVAKIFRL